MANGTAADTWSCVLRGLLIPLSLVYAQVQRTRGGLYRTGILKTRKLPRPVISIGNIAVGGTGKTPVTAHIARLLLARGLKVAVLSRGYGGTHEGQTVMVSDGHRLLLSAGQCGDEPFLLAKSVPGLAVVIGSNRHAAGQLALKECDSDIFLLDDGFQHLRLHRDMNILLLDAVNPFGNGWCLPAGLLREPVRAALRADWIIHTRGQDGKKNTPLLTKIPQSPCRYRLGRLIPLSGGDPIALESVDGCGIMACAGIAEPEQFFRSLEERGIRLLCRLPLADHAVFDAAVISGMMDALRTSSARYCIVTEKDAVKLSGIPESLAAAILVAPLELELEDDRLVPYILNLL